MRTFGLKERLYVALAVLVLCWVSAGMWTQEVHHRVGERVAEAQERNHTAADAIGDAADRLDEEDEALAALFHGQANASAALAEARAGVDAATTTAAAALTGRAEEPEVGALRVAFARYREASEAARRDPAGHSPAYELVVLPELRRARASARRMAKGLLAGERETVARAYAEADASKQVHAITLGALVASLLAAWQFARHARVSLGALKSGATAIAGGDFEHRLPEGRDDELGAVARAFNQMAARLAGYARTNVEGMLRLKGLLEATLEALPDAVLLIGAGGRVLAMNRAARELFGCADLASAQAAELSVGGVGLAKLVEAGRAAAARGLGDLEGALRVARDDGTTMRLVPRAFDGPGAPDDGAGVVILALYDVTEAARAVELHASVVAFAAHEMQASLASAMFAFELLRDDDSVHPAARAFAEAGARAVSQLAETASSFLDRARVEAGHLKLDLASVNVASWVAEVVRPWEGLAGTKCVRIETLGVAEAGAIAGDAQWLRAALNNLVGNAVKHSPREGVIRVAAELRAETLVVTVCDEGPGVPAAERELVFGKFYQGAQGGGVKRVGVAGSGIGLFLCREVVRLHRGRVWCEDGEGGRGTRMVMELPVGGPGRG